MRIKSVETPEDVKAIGDLTGKVFTGYFNLYKEYGEDIPSDPFYDKEMSKVIEVDGRIVSHIDVVDRQMRIGSCSVRMGGIGGVVTHPDYRKRNFARILMNECIDLMTSREFDVSMLFGIPNFYPKFGYVTSLFNYRCTLKAQKVLSLKRKPRTELLSEGHMGNIAPIYEKATSSLNCSIVRTHEYWKWLFERSRDPSGIVLKGRGNKVLGYAVLSSAEDRIRVEEAFVADDRLSLVYDLLYAIARRAEDELKPRIELIIPSDSFMDKICYYELEAEINKGTHKDAGGMLRIINLLNTFKKVSPVLYENLCESELRRWKGSFVIGTDIGAIRISIDRDSLEVEDASGSNVDVLMPQRSITKLLVGFQELDLVMLDEKVEIPRRLFPVVKALFPLRSSYVASIDHF